MKRAGIEKKSKKNHVTVHSGRLRYGKFACSRGTGAVESLPKAGKAKRQKTAPICNNEETLPILIFSGYEFLWKISGRLERGAKKWVKNQRTLKKS